MIALFRKPELSQRHRYGLTCTRAFNQKANRFTVPTYPRRSRTSWLFRRFEGQLECGVLFGNVHVNPPWYIRRTMPVLMEVRFHLQSGDTEVMLMYPDGSDPCGWDEKCWTTHEQAREWIKRCKLEYKRRKKLKSSSRGCCNVDCIS